MNKQRLITTVDKRHLVNKKYLQQLLPYVELGLERGGGSPQREQGLRGQVLFF